MTKRILGYNPAVLPLLPDPRYYNTATRFSKPNNPTSSLISWLPTHEDLNIPTETQNTTESLAKVKINDIIALSSSTDPSDFIDQMRTTFGNFELQLELCEVWEYLFYWNSLLTTAWFSLVTSTQCRLFVTFWSLRSSYSSTVEKNSEEWMTYPNYL